MPTPTLHQNQPPSHNRKSIRFDGSFIFAFATAGVGAVVAVANVVANVAGGVAAGVAVVTVVVVAVVITRPTRSSGAARWSRALLEARERGRGCRLTLAGWIRSRTRFGRRIAVLAALMAPAARCRWLELVAESLHDFDVAEHPELLRDFRRHAVMVILRSWTVDFSRSRAS